MVELSRDEIIQIAKEHAPDMPPELALSVWQQESGGGKNTKTSSRNARGAFQVTPIAAKDVGLPDADLSDPYDNAVVGIKYLAKNYASVAGDPFQTAARYFGGPTAMSNLDITDGRVSRRDYATQVTERYKKMALTEDPASGAPGTGVVVPPPLQETGTVVDKLLAAFTVSTNANSDAVKNIQNAVKVSQDQTAEAVDIINQKGNLAKQVALDMGTQMQSKASAAAKNASIAGIAKDDVNSLFADLVTEYNTTAENARVLQKDIMERKKVTLLDNPIDFLKNQFVEIPQRVSDHNALVDLANQDAKRITDLNAMVQNQNVTDNAQIADVSMQGAIATAEIKSLEARREASILRSANAVQVAQLSVNQATIENKGLNELQQMETIKSTTAYRKILEASAADAGALKKMKLEEQQRFQKDLSTMGYTQEQFKGLNQASQDALIKVIATGKLGNSPMEAILNLKEIPNAKLSTGQAILSNMFVNLYNGTNINTNPAFAKKEDKVAQGNKFIQDAFEVWRNNPGSGSDNPYQAPSPTAMGQFLSEDKFNPVFVKTIKTAGSLSKGNKVDDLALVQTALAAVGTDGYTREQAINDVTNYYQEAIKRNNTLFRFQDFGLKNQLDYKTAIRIPQGIPAANRDKEFPGFESSYGILGTNVKMDLANPTAVSSLVTLLQAKDMVRKGSLIRSRQEQGITGSTALAE